MSRSCPSNPRTLSMILDELFTVRAYGRACSLNELQQVWNQAVGEPDCWQTHVTGIRHGVLNVTVAHCALLEELHVFRKQELLSTLKTKHVTVAIYDIRFRIGSVETQGPR